MRSRMAGYQGDPVWLVQQLLRRIEVTESGCWEWQGSMVGRYGTFSFGGRTQLAHRASYEAFHGPIAAARVIDHLCGNARCIHPHHLQEVPQSINVRRGRGPALTRARSRKERCCHGHLLTPENVYQQRKGPYVIWHCRACANEHHRRYRARRQEERDHHAA